MLYSWKKRIEQSELEESYILVMLSIYSKIIIEAKSLLYLYECLAATYPYDYSCIQNILHFFARKYRF